MLQCPSVCDLSSHRQTDPHEHTHYEVAHLCLDVSGPLDMNRQTLIHTQMHRTIRGHKDRDGHLPEGVRHARSVLDSCHILHQRVLMNLHGDGWTL